MDPGRTAVDSICVTRGATVLDALKALSAGRVGLALVTDEERRVIGTVTDGDVRSSLIRGGSLETPVADVMCPRFHHVRDEGNHRARAMDLMVAHRIKQVPVLDGEGRLQGLHVMEEYLTPEPLPNWAVVLAGGRGTRLQPLTRHLPKPMLPVAGRPILERLILGLVGDGIRRIFLAVNYMKEVISDHFGDGSGFGCTIEYLEESRPLGTAGPLGLLPETPSSPILLMNGDLVAEFSARLLLEHHARLRNDVTVGVGLHSHQIPFGVVDVDGDRVTQIVEKPRYNWLINQGVYAISPELVGLVDPAREFPVTDLIDKAMDDGRRVGHFEMEGDWIDVGRPADLRRARGR